MPSFQLMAAALPDMLRASPYAIPIVENNDLLSFECGFVVKKLSKSERE